MKITHDFKLPFEWPKKEAFSAGDEGYDRDAHLKALKAAIPESAKYLAGC